MTRYINLANLSQETITAIEMIWRANEGEASDGMRKLAQQLLEDRNLPFPIKKPTDKEIGDLRGLSLFLDKVALGEVKPAPGSHHSSIDNWIFSEINLNKSHLAAISYLKNTWSIKKNWLSRKVSKVLNADDRDVPVIKVPTHTELTRSRSKLITRTNMQSNNNNNNNNNSAHSHHHNVLPVPEPSSNDSVTIIESRADGTSIGVIRRSPQANNNNNDHIYDVVQFNSASKDKRTLLSGASRQDLDAVNSLVAGDWPEVAAMQRHIFAANGQHHTATTPPVHGIYEQPTAALDATPDSDGDTPAEQLAHEQWREMQRESQKSNNAKGL